jgi:hypothetical protein
MSSKRPGKFVKQEDPEQGIGEPESVDKTNFKSELQYDGYQDIEDYDNDVFEANPEEEINPDKELNIEERVEPNIPLGSQASEEDLLDPQGNREEDRQEEEERLEEERKRA